MNKRMLSLSVLPSGVFKLNAAEQVSYMPFGGESSAAQAEENTMMPAAQEKPQENILP